jgi:hypothetical protein
MPYAGRLVMAGSVIFEGLVVRSRIYVGRFVPNRQRNRLSPVSEEASSKPRRRISHDMNHELSLLSTVILQHNSIQ